MTTSFAQFDGPRLVQREELIASIRLFRTCFELAQIQDEEEILADYVPPKPGRIYVLAHEGELVSQITTFYDHLRIYDASIRVGSIAGVGTHPDHRGKGLASHLVEHCTGQLVQEGARLMLISGDEGVYTRLGSVLHGRFMHFSIQPGQGSQWRPTPADLVVRKATPADATACSRLYQAEPVHFIRRNSDFSAVLHDPTRNTFVHAEQWIIERAGQAVAYLFLGMPWGQPGGLGAGIRHVGEYAGSRLALADALNLIITTNDLRDFTWPVAWQDVELIQLLQDGGSCGTVTPLEGFTLRIIDFAGLMKDLRPILQARLGADLLRGLSFEQRGPLLGGSGADRYIITRGADRLELDGATMTRLVMGSTDIDAGSIPVPGALAEVVRALFPLPSFLHGLNYH